MTQPCREFLNHQSVVISHSRDGLACVRAVNPITFSFCSPSSVLTREDLTPSTCCCTDHGDSLWSVSLGMWKEQSVGASWLCPFQKGPKKAWAAPAQGHVRLSTSLTSMHANKQTTQPQKTIKWAPPREWCLFLITVTWMNEVMFLLGSWYWWHSGVKQAHLKKQ